MTQLTSTNPVTGNVLWQGDLADADAVNVAVAQAQRDAQTWATTPIEERITRLKHFADLARASRDALATLIMHETGKPLWEAQSEADLVTAKVDVTLDAFHTRHRQHQIDLPQGTGTTFYQGFHSVVAVLGPFNLPAHLPNGHIIPALLAGNAIVFKPSEHTPAVGEMLVCLYHQANLPAVHLVQGGRDTGEALVCHKNLAGVFFTGSTQAGQAIHRALGGRPQVMLALEMGGNNPLVVHHVSDLEAAAYTIITSAFITSGQRCTCARRLIVTHDDADALVERLIDMMRTLRVGLPDAQPPPFLGTLIHASAAQSMLDAQQQFIAQGGQTLVEMQTHRASPAMLSPGLMDVTQIEHVHDEEHFGPLLKLIRVRNFDDAIEEANRTRFGLAAALLSDDASLWQTFRERVRAGVVNFNTATTGASGKLPFGGLGASGNHRASGYHAMDYCGDDIASIEVKKLSIPKKRLPGL